MKDYVRAVLACLRVCLAQKSRLAGPQYVYISATMALQSSTSLCQARAPSLPTCFEMDLSLPVCSLLCTFTLATSMLPYFVLCSDRPSTSMSPCASDRHCVLMFCTGFLLYSVFKQPSPPSRSFHRCRETFINS